MTLAATLAYDTDQVLFNLADFAEAADYQATGVPAVRVRAIWGRIEKEDTGNGFIADTTTVQVPAADLLAFGEAVTPNRKRTTELIRYPDALVSREAWLVSDVSRLDAHVWELRVWRLPEATVQGGAG